MDFLSFCDISGKNPRVTVNNSLLIPVLMYSPEVQEHPWAHALGCPSLGRTYSCENLPYNFQT